MKKLLGIVVLGWMIFYKEWTLVRKKVFQYDKSGKLLIFPIREPGGGAFIMDLNPNFGFINLRTVKRMPNITATNYEADILVKSNKENGEIYAECELLRILNLEEINLKNWEPNKKINEIKVLPYKHITEEENYWAGKVKGNEVGYFLNWIAYLGLASWFYKSGAYEFSNFFNGGWFLYLVSISWGFFNIKDKLIKTKKPLNSKIEELNKYKDRLINNKKLQIKENLTRLDKALLNFSTWSDLSPIEFENALSRKLNQLGMKVSTTKTSGDGGIDLIGEDENNNEVIIQAKKYSKPVGVAVVREMLGVREHHSNYPRTIIYSLEGFTKGAEDVAKSNDIELKSIREDLIKR